LKKKKRMRKKPSHFTNGHKKILTAVTVSCVVLAVLCGCSPSNKSKYGRLERSPEITEIFETDQVLADHNYYYSGFQAIPYSIVGIHQEYTLRSSAWKEITPGPALLNRLITRMRSVYTPDPQGAWILGPDRERVGVWYSSERQTAVRIGQDNRISIAPPEPAELRGIP
jgi:hypothetical protein